jgi:D-serine deaminase-like pyridoxal phosphate-dependent protein
VFTVDQLPADLPTPCLVVDGATVRANIARMAEYCRQHRLRLRPHTKTHKSRFVAQMQMAAGASGLTVAKAAEAQVMAAVAADVLLAYPAVDPARTRRMAALARERTVRVGIDSAEAASALSAAAAEFGSTIGILVDLDLGFGRTGVQTAEDARQLAQGITRLPGLRLDGVMFFPGHVGGSPDEQRPLIESAASRLREVLDLWRQDGLEAKIVSGGSTPTAMQSHLFEVLTEIRPGTYVFNGTNELYAGYATLDQCAARIICTVVSAAVPGKIVLDGGTKAFTSDRCGPKPESGSGYIIEFPEAKIVRLTEEHGEVDVSACDRRPKIGQRVSVIPNHICPCVNLTARFGWWEMGALTPVTVDARGLVS